MRSHNHASQGASGTHEKILFVRGGLSDESPLMSERFPGDTTFDVFRKKDAPDLKDLKRQMPHRGLEPLF
jgi:hypothetical protein